MVLTEGKSIHRFEPLIALTGAWISAESGAPTFRGEQGLWREFRAEELATPESFQKDPYLVWQFYDWRRQILAGCPPNHAHQTLKEMEQYLDAFCIITQNVDGLHACAGNQRVLELHVFLWNMKCTVCDAKWEDL